MTQETTRWLIGSALQTCAVGYGILTAYRKWTQEQTAATKRIADARVEAAERLTRMETKVDILFKFWDHTMERRSKADQQRYEAAQERRALGAQMVCEAEVAEAHGNDLEL